MEIIFRQAQPGAPERIYIGAVELKNFRGNAIVDVQLFRPSNDMEELTKLKGRNLVGQPDPAMPKELLAGATEDSALACLMEAFTLEEMEQIKSYFSRRYGEQIATLNICPMSLPVPLGVGPLALLPEGLNSGFIHFDMAPGYDLPFALKGYYDLESQSGLDK